VRVVIDGHHLPGRTFHSDGVLLENVHVGTQIGREASDLVPADASSARWELDVRVVDVEGGRDFRGPAVQGKRGDRFLYLTWGDLDGVGHFVMFRRAKLMLDRIDPDLLDAAVNEGATLVARVHLTDDRGCPRCARVDPPAIAWEAT
jgi:hypothetical protein